MLLISCAGELPTAKKDEPLPDDARPPPEPKEPAELPGKKKYIPPYTPKSALDRARAAAADTARHKAEQAARAQNQKSALQMIPKGRTGGGGGGGATSNGRPNHQNRQVHNSTGARPSMPMGGGGGGGKKRRGDISDDELADLESKSRLACFNLRSCTQGQAKFCGATCLLLDSIQNSQEHLAVSSFTGLKVPNQSLPNRFLHIEEPFGNT